MARRWMFLAGICLAATGLTASGCLSLWNYGSNITCVDDGNCPGGFICDGAAGLCIVDMEGRECDHFSDCNEHQRCIDEVCVFSPECIEHTDCFTGQECLENECVPLIPCDYHRDCASFQSCAFGGCIPRECGQDADCNADQRCWWGGECISGARENCDNFECAWLPEAPLCVDVGTGPKCDLVECFSDLVCGANSICDNLACSDAHWLNPMPAGFHCQDASDCIEGYCHHYDSNPNNTFCSQDCDASDPYSCTAWSFCHEDGHCAPAGPRNIGRDCVDDLNCRFGICLTSDGSSYCSSFCSDTIGCQSGWTCVDLDDSERKACQRP